MSKKIFYVPVIFQFLKEKYPIDRRRNAGAKPRNIELSLDKTPVAEKSGRTSDTPTQEASKNVKFQKRELKQAIYIRTEPLVYQKPKTTNHFLYPFVIQTYSGTPFFIDSKFTCVKNKQKYLALI